MVEADVHQPVKHAALLAESRQEHVKKLRVMRFVAPVDGVRD